MKQSGPEYFMEKTDQAFVEKQYLFRKHQEKVPDCLCR
jgi:hypothetical protein